jgi:hypothetical protein
MVVVVIAAVLRLRVANRRRRVLANLGVRVDTNEAAVHVRSERGIGERRIGPGRRRRLHRGRVGDVVIRVERRAIVIRVERRAIVARRARFMMRHVRGFDWFVRIPRRRLRAAGHRERRSDGHEAAPARPAWPSKDRSGRGACSAEGAARIGGSNVTVAGVAHLVSAQEKPPSSFRHSLTCARSPRKPRREPHWPWQSRTGPVQLFARASDAEWRRKRRFTLAAGESSEESVRIAAIRRGVVARRR